MIDKEVESKKNKEPAEVNVAPKPALVTVRSQHGWTPLLLAISAPKQTKADALNAHKCVEFLLENGADSNTWVWFVPMHFCMIVSFSYKVFESDEDFSLISDLN